MGANAQTSVPAFTAGQILTAVQQTQINTGIPVFATTTTRDAAFGGTGEKTLAEGQVCYIEGAPNRLQIYDGSAWLNVDTKFTDFTPTWTNLTPGNASQTAQYIQIGKFVYVEGQITFGSTSSMGTNPRFALPVTASGTKPSQQFLAHIFDQGTAILYGTLEPTSNAELFIIGTGGTYASRDTITNTVPFTWTTNDSIRYNFIYEAA